MTQLPKTITLKELDDYINSSFAASHMRVRLSYGSCLIVPVDKMNLLIDLLRHSKFLSTDYNKPSAIREASPEDLMIEVFPNSEFRKHAASALLQVPPMDIATEGVTYTRKKDELNF